MNEIAYFVPRLTDSILLDNGKKIDIENAELAGIILVYKEKKEAEKHGPAIPIKYIKNKFHKG